MVDDLMVDGSAAEGEASDGVVVEKKIGAKEVEVLPRSDGPVATHATGLSAYPCLPSPHHPPSMSCSYSRTPFPHMQQQQHPPWLSSCLTSCLSQHLRQ